VEFRHRLCDYHRDVVSRSGGLLRDSLVRLDDTFWSLRCPRGQDLYVWRILNGDAEDRSVLRATQQHRSELRSELAIHFGLHAGRGKPRIRFHQHLDPAVDDERLGCRVIGIGRQWVGSVTKPALRFTQHCIRISLVITLALAASGCGVDPRNTRGSVEAPPIADEDVVGLIERVNGDVADQRGLEQIYYVRLQGGLKRCMETHGFDYAPPPFGDPYEDWDHASVSSDFPSLVSITGQTDAGGVLSGATTTLLTIRELDEQAAHRNPGFENLRTEEERRAYIDTGAQCSPLDEELDRGLSDESTPIVRRALFDLLAAVENSPAVREAMGRYARCLDSYGITASSLTELRQLVFAAFNEAEISRGVLDTPGSLGWNQAVEQQNRSATADRACRAKPHELALAELNRQLPMFLADHTKELDEVDHHWDTISVLVQSIAPEFETYNGQRPASSLD
jgi:hypothetical protein